MNLDKNVHAKIMCRSGQAAGLHVGDAGHDDQDTVGAVRTGLIDLIRIEQKILAKARQMRHLPRRREIAETALERRPIGEHRKTCGTARLIGAGQGGRIEIGADQPLRWTRFFDLRDQCNMAGFALGLDRLDEAARRIVIMRLAGQGLERHAHLGRRDFAPLIGLDLLQNIGHRSSLGGLHGHTNRQCGAARFDTFTSLASVPAARPSSMAAAAKAAPCFKSSAFPATTSAIAAFRMAISR